MQISLIVCTYNRSKILKISLTSLCNLELPEDTKLEVLVVDNNSNDQTKAEAQDFISSLNQLRDKIIGKYIFEKKQGLSFARNTGYANSIGDYIAYIDDECILPKQWLQEAVKIINNAKPAFLGGPYFGKYIPGLNSNWYKESFGDSYILQHDLSNGPMKNNYLSGGNIFIRRDVFEKIGVFDPNLGMSGYKINYGEEQDLQKRFLTKYPDEVNWYDNKLFVWHMIRGEKMRLSFLIKDALIRGKSSAASKSTTRIKLLLSPFLFLFFVLKAIFSALGKGLKSLILREHFFTLLYEDYENGTWRDIGGAFYNSKRLLGL